MKKEKRYYSQNCLIKIEKKSRNKLSREMLERKYRKLENYIITHRNEGLKPIDREVFGFDKEKVLALVESYPNILTASIGNKIDPCLEKLDRKLPKRKTNYIFAKYANIVCTSLDRLDEQLALLEKYNLLEAFSVKPKNFMYPPESIYALIQFALNDKPKDVDDAKYLASKPTSEIFLNNSKLSSKGLSIEKLRKMYPYKNKEKEMNGDVTIEEQ